MPFIQRGRQLEYVSDGVEVRYIKEGWKLISRDEANGIKPEPVAEVAVEVKAEVKPEKPKTRRTTQRAK